MKQHYSSFQDSFQRRADDDNRNRSIGRKSKLHQKTENKNCDDNHIHVQKPKRHFKFDNSKLITFPVKKNPLAIKSSP